MSDFKIVTKVVGAVSTNCYIIYNQESKEAILVDPGDNGAYIVETCRELEINPQAILLTHGHFDHILAAEEIQKTCPIPIYAGRKEEELLGDSSLNLSHKINRNITISADTWLDDKDILTLAGFTIEVITTPGHTPGGVCYFFTKEQILISGDTLFLDSLGRTDLPKGDQDALVASIKEKLFSLPEETLVYPGHGEPTTIAYEKEHNPAASYTG